MKPAEFKAARVAMGFTQAALATSLQVSPSTIRRWEMEPSVKSSRKPNKFAVMIIESMLVKRGIEIERE